MLHGGRAFLLLGVVLDDAIGLVEILLLLKVDLQGSLQNGEGHTSLIIETHLLIKHVYPIQKIQKVAHFHSLCQGQHETNLCQGQQLKGLSSYWTKTLISG